MKLEPLQLYLATASSFPLYYKAGAQGPHKPLQMCLGGNSKDPLTQGGISSNEMLWGRQYKIRQ